MKIFVVTRTSYNGESFTGSTSVDCVFSSEEKAKAYFDSVKKNHWYEYVIEEFDVE